MPLSLLFSLLFYFLPSLTTVATIRNAAKQNFVCILYDDNEDLVFIDSHIAYIIVQYLK